jgi:hypothetical protein
VRQNNIAKEKPMKTEIQKPVTFFIQNLEAFIWIVVLVYFAISPVHATGHFTICPLSLAGFEYCPGCGLGRSIILLLHGKITESFSMHPLAFFAVAVLIARIVSVFRKYFRYQKQVSTMNNIKL